MARQARRAEEVARERIEYLYGLAQRTLETDPRQSRRAIEMLRAVATKHNIRITDKKRTFCLRCGTLLVPGKTATVRVHHGKRVITCLHCGTVKRLGLR